MDQQNDILNQTVSAEKHKLKSTSLLTDRGVLVILSSNYFGKSFIIDKINNIIGRHSSCDIIIKDPLVSKNHCRIIFEEDEKFYIEDLGSKNSTFLNEKELKKKEHIIYGDRIVIGNTIMRFYLEEKID